jgi:predicted O-methyltransferase YrrM
MRVSPPVCQDRRVSAPPDLPPVVQRALDLSRRRGFVSSTRNETGRLLAALAATRSGTLAECGTGCGVGSAWLRSGVRGDARIVTAELDHRLAEAVRTMFEDDGQVEVLQADWTTLRDHAPFSLLFLDVREAKQNPPEFLTELVEPGGIVVLDDFTPFQGWPPVYEGRVDTTRQQWLTDERFTTAEVMVAVDAAVLIATRR